MKMLILKQAKIENESDPKVIPLADCAISIEEIQQVHSVIDKYDCLIKGVTGIRTRQNDGFYVVGDFRDIMEKIEQLSFV